MEGYEVLPSENRHHWLATRFAIMFTPIAGLVLATLLGAVPDSTWTVGYWAVQVAYMVGETAAILAALFLVGADATLILGEGGIIVEIGVRSWKGRVGAPWSSVALRANVAYVYVGPYGPPTKILLSPRQALRVRARMRIPIPS